MPLARGQARSNSGVYLHDCYEIQVLDSFGLEGENNECGGFYQLRKPGREHVLPAAAVADLRRGVHGTEVRGRQEDRRRPGQGPAQRRGDPPRFELAHDTPGRENEGPAPRPLYLQGHGNKVEFRNVWLVEKK